MYASGEFSTIGNIVLWFHYSLAVKYILNHWDTYRFVVPQLGLALLSAKFLSIFLFPFFSLLIGLLTTSN